jgi:HEPN domain-containing protein
VLDAFPGCDLLVYTPEELEEMRRRPGIVAEVLREGVRIYGELRGTDVSDDEARAEAGWLAQSESDLAFAEHGLRLGFHAHACFLAQQAAEKAAKAIHYARGARAVLGRSVDGLLAALERAGLDAAALRPLAKQLDLHYVPARYPSGLPGNVPSEAYTAGQAAGALEGARRILAFARAGGRGAIGARGRLSAISPEPRVESRRLRRRARIAARSDQSSRALARDSRGASGAASPEGAARTAAGCISPARRRAR